MPTSDFNSAGQLNQLEHDPDNHAKRVNNYIWNGSAWERQSGGSGGDGAILDGSNSAIKATVKDLGTQVVTADNGLVTNTVIHGKTTAGGGSYVDVKVTPSGALSVEADIQNEVTAYAKPSEAYAISNKEATATYKYFGFQRLDGYWYIMRKTLATNVFEYVTGTSAYSTAWSNRAGQTYTDYATAF